MAPEPTFPSRMSETEALMWNVEKDPMLRSSFANVTLLDRPADVDRLRKRLEDAVRAFPRLRQRVVASAGRLAPPEWVADPFFDLDFHVRSLRVPGAGRERDLFDLATELVEDPFDRARPLWHFWVIDGLEGGRGAMVQHLHHTITDGEGGVRLSAMFLDLERDAAGAMIAAAPVAADDAAEAPRNLFDATTAAVGHLVESQLAVARGAVGGAVDLVRDPAGIPAAAARTAALAGSVIRQLGPADRPKSPLWKERSLGRRFEVLRVGLDEAKAAAHRLGGTVNDLFVAGAAGAAGEYHRANGVEVDELRISMPVSTRAKGSGGGNSFTPLKVLVPVGAPPQALFAEVHRRMEATKHEPAVGAIGSLAGVLNVLPTSSLVRLARQQVGTVDFAVSNVRGAPFDLYIAGAKIEANYPMGPTAGTAWNLTTLSSGGNLDMGLNIDTGAVAQPGLLRDLLAEAYAGLLSASS